MSDTLLGIQGGKYKTYIDALVELEETKRKPLDARVEKTESQQRVWNEIGRNLTDVRTALSRLQGFESVFGERMVNSGNENAMVAFAKRNVTPANLEVKVEQRAEADRFFSENLANDLEVNAGNYNFSVGNEAVNFRYEGGSLTDFAAKLSAVDPELLKASVIRTTPDQSSLFLESQLTGKDNKLDFKDDARPFAFDIGLITDKIEAKYQVASDSQNSLKPGSEIDILKRIKLTQGRFLDINVATEDILPLKEGAYLSFDYQTKEKAPSILRTKEFQLNQASANNEGFLDKIRDGGSLNMPEITGETNVYVKVDDELVEVATLVPQEQLTSVKIDLGQLSGAVNGIYLSNTNSASDFETENMLLFIPGDVDFVPVNPASRAQNAEFTMDGVKVSRPVNEVTDILPDVTFTVKGKSEQPFKVSIQYDVKTVNDAIQDFIWAYDMNMAKINVLTATPERTEIVEELSYLSKEQQEELMEELALFSGDQTLIGMKNRFHTMMIDAQTVGVNTKEPKKMQLKEMGIATNLNAGQASLSSQMRGYFEVNSDDLNAALENRWEDVREFFSRNQTGQGLADAGLAVDISQFINGYTTSNGIIQTKTDTLASQLKRQQKEVEDFNTKLEDKKKRWEADFSKAEAAENSMKKSMEQFDNMLGNNK